jgi:nicotinate-nucleotide adenylyltransferase
MAAVGVFGGSFDPVHSGHLIIAQRLIEIRGLSGIIFVPCHISPHKIEKGAASPEKRLEMLKLAIEGNPSFAISTFELENEGISYTIDTLRELKKYYDNLELIIGYDNILQFNTWKEPDEIFNVAKVIVMKRPGSVETEEKDKYYKKAVFVDTPLLDISSTEIRGRVKNNLRIDFMTPEKVMNYIYRKKLYKEE